MKDARSIGRLIGALCATLVIFGTTASAGYASSCDSLVAQLQDRVQANERLWFTLVSNHPQQRVTYATGSLEYSPSGWFQGFWGSSSLLDDSVSFSGGPFDPENADDFMIFIGNDAKTVVVWINGYYRTITPTCTGGISGSLPMMHGFRNSESPYGLLLDREMYVVSFSSTPIPR